MRSLLRAAIGAVLLVGLAGWSLVSSPSAPGAREQAGAVLVLGAGLLVGALGARVWAPAPALALVTGVVAAFVVTAPDSTSGAPLAPPLHYENANGELLLIAAAGLAAAASRRRPAFRVGTAVVAAGVAGATWSLGAQASALAAGLLVAWSLVGGLGGRVAGRWWQAVGVVLVAAPIAATAAWASGVEPGARVVRALSEERLDLWHEALDILRADPVTGAGPGRFAELSPTASADADLSWAHSYVFQTAAELGVVGLVLVGLLLVWALWVLGRHAPLLGIVLLPASIDYVLDFGWVLASLGVVVGASMVVAGSGKPGLTPPSP